MEDDTCYMMRDVPHEERPRERMLEYGASALNHVELLAIVLRTGTRQQSVLRLAQRLLAEAGGLRSLIDLTVTELMKIKGIGQAKAIQLKAVIELGHRISRTKLPVGSVIRTPEDVANLMMEQLKYLHKEHFVCLFLNTKNYMIAQETLSIGSLDAAIVHPREVFRAAIKCSSASIVCVHNHPSGDPAPSDEDIKLTQRLIEVGKIVGIDVLDHVIIGDGVYVSLKSRGVI